MKRIIDIPDDVVKAIRNDEDYRYDIHTAIAQSIPYDEAEVWRKSNELLEKRLKYLGNPKGDLISRRALLNQIDTTDWSDVRLLAEDAQTVEITEEQAINKLHETGWLIEHDKEMTTRPKGEWKTVEGVDGDEYYECSNCGEPWVLMAGAPKDNNMNFCPNCGAYMKGDAE